MTQGNDDIKVMPQKIFCSMSLLVLLPGSSADEKNVGTKIKSNRT